MGRKNVYKPAAAGALVLVVATLLWFASPVQYSALTYNNQGLVYNNEGEYDQAIAAFNKAIELDPELAFAYNNRGWA